MGTNRYSSFEEIDIRLKILKLEKEIVRLKTASNFRNIKDSFAPQNIIHSLLDSIKSSSFSSNEGMIAKFIPSFIKKLLHKKRG